MLSSMLTKKGIGEDLPANKALLVFPHKSSKSGVRSRGDSNRRSNYKQKVYNQLR